MRNQARFLTLVLLLVVSQSVFAQSSSVLGADSMFEIIKQAMLPAFNKLSTQALRWLAAFATIQFFITNWNLLLDEADISKAVSKLVGAVAWVGFVLYLIENGPQFIQAVGDQMFGLAGTIPTPASIMTNTFALAGTLAGLALGVGAVPFVGGTAGNLVLWIMIVSLVVGLYFALKIFMLQIEVALIATLSPLSFAFLGLKTLRDQGIAPFKSLLALAYRIILVGVIMTAFGSVSDALTSSLQAMTVEQAIAKGLDALLGPPVAAIGAYLLLAFLLFKSDAIASSLAAGTASLGAGDVTSAAAAGAAVGAFAATSGASAVSAAGKAPQSMSAFMDKVMGRSSISNASAMGSGGDAPVFHAPKSALSSVGAPAEGSAGGGTSAPQPPSRPQGGAASSPSMSSNVASGRFGADLNDAPNAPSVGRGAATEQAPASAQGDAVGAATEGAGSSTAANPGQAPASARGNTEGAATIGGAQAAGSTGTGQRLEEILDKLASNIGQPPQPPRKPTLGERLGEANRHLSQERATTHVSVSGHHHD